MNAGSLIFLGSGLLCLSGALATLLARDALKASLGLGLLGLGLWGLFLKLNAQFLAFAELSVWGSLIIATFVVMSALPGGVRRTSAATLAGPAPVRLVAASGVFALSVVICTALALQISEPIALAPPRLDLGSAEDLGGQLFGERLALFALTVGGLLIAALGALVLLGPRVPAVSANSEQAPFDAAKAHPHSWFSGPLSVRDAERPLEGPDRGGAP
jgi:NADH:ubiquinone oxidoreductase subunit 6 (subunit J)